MHNRRARPTLRVLGEDLNSAWEDPAPKRALEEGRLDALHPLSELPHPIIRRASECFSENEAEDQFEMRIASATEKVLLEIKTSQWRGAVWVDQDTGVCWLVAAGLAKGNHEDFHDFYKQVERQNITDGCESWLPTEKDVRLLKLETAARLKTDWFLDIQKEVFVLLKAFHQGGSGSFEVVLPIVGQKLAEVELTVEQHRGDGVDSDDIVVEVHPAPQFAGHAHLWDLIVRVLCSIAPPVQGWDTTGLVFANIGEPGAWTQRVAELEQLIDRGELSYPEPGQESHYAHHEHLAFKTIDGKAVRSLCGVSFVPSRDHANLPVCPECSRLYGELA